jgi:hypothetical protein
MGLLHSVNISGSASKRPLSGRAVWIVATRTLFSHDQRIFSYRQPCTSFLFHCLDVTEQESPRDVFGCVCLLFQACLLKILMLPYSIAYKLEGGCFCYISVEHSQTDNQSTMPNILGDALLYSECACNQSPSCQGQNGPKSRDRQAFPFFA